MDFILIQIIPVIMWIVYRSDVRLATIAGLVAATIGVVLMWVFRPVVPIGIA
jgi:hypothetical protein